LENWSTLYKRDPHSMWKRPYSRQSRLLIL
jgi:hypothetical protein